MTLSSSLISQMKSSKTLFGELVLRIKYASCRRPTIITSKIGLSHNSHQIRFVTSQKDKRAKLLMTLTGCSNSLANKFVDSLSCNNEIDEERITKIYNVLKDLGYKNEDIAECLNIFGKHPLTLKNYYMVLEEAGMDCSKISLSILAKYRSLVQRTVRSLKVHGMINDDVVKLYASYTGMPDSAWPSSLPDSSSLTNAQTCVLRAFIAWRFEISTEKVDKILRTYGRIKNKSFRLMQEVLTILENDIGFTKEKIMKHFYLLHCDPDNIRELMRQIDTLGGISLLKVLSTNPKILVYPVEGIIKINNLLKENNIPNAAIARTLDIFTLSSETVETRLKLLNTMPHSAHLLDHPAVLMFVVYYKKAADRLMVLEKLKMKCASLHILFSKKDMFEKYAKNGEDRTRGDDILFFLSKEFSMDSKSIRSSLKKHSYWYHVSLMNIIDTLKYLYSKKFQQEEIIKNIHILLYPKSLIDKEMLKLECQPNLGLCKTSEGNLRRETLLPLILYYIEQPHHFSGGGIWSLSKTGLSMLPYYWMNSDSSEVDSVKSQLSTE